tara:strand:- start:1359 stop:1589 length:231 start_codon:yes stop_codon:yes gene_type:complete
MNWEDIIKSEYPDVVMRVYELNVKKGTGKMSGLYKSKETLKEQILKHTEKGDESMSLDELVRLNPNVEYQMRFVYE